MNSKKQKQETTTTLEELTKLKVVELKIILRENGQPTSGKKADLVLRCDVIQKRKELQSISQSSTSGLSVSIQSTSSRNTGQITFNVLSKEAETCIWTTDLRKLPPFNFVQLYDYLVLETSKYDHETIKKAGYKKLKSFKFFKEGHIKQMTCGTRNDDMIYVKCEVLASMKQQRYNVMVCFDSSGNIQKAACECPAGRGVSGLGKCNHVGGILFATEDFCRQGLKESTDPITCTSRLCEWNVPRKMKVDPKPVDDIVITKYHYGKKAAAIAKVSLYDPRAPAHRCLNQDSLQQLSSRLVNCLSSSSFFLFYDLKSTKDKETVVIESMSETVPINAPEATNEGLPFNDDYDISSNKFNEMLDKYKETVTDQEIGKVETQTRGQNNNQAWKELKRDKLTASNFKAAALRRKEPDLFLKRIMYIKENKASAKSLVYGIQHEDDAVLSYINTKQKQGNVNLKVEEVGTILSKERPGLGASLDRKVYDPLAKGMEIGGLEVKCPYSKRGMTVAQACEDKAFYLGRDKDRFSLKCTHQYFYQVQGQMFVCKLKWVDFGVWFGNNDIFIERIYFNSKWWFAEVLPKLDFFYKWAFLPEIFTRRIERGVRLYKHGGWKNFKQCHITRSV